MNTPAADMTLLRILQLASPALPVGAYAYSQGLEWAVEAGWVNDEETLADWIEDQLMHIITTTDLPLFVRLHQAAAACDEPALLAWSRTLIASRETSELVADDCDRGRALARLLDGLGVTAARPWLERADTPFAAVSAVGAVAWDIPCEQAALAYAWGWLENQVLVGVKLVPLGQLDGQKVLLQLAAKIPDALATALGCADDDIGGMVPVQALASSLHETQYTRLFRS